MAPLTSQATAVLLVPETLAENCFVAPSCRLVLLGVTEIATGTPDEMDTMALAEADGWYTDAAVTWTELSGAVAGAV